MGQEGTFCLGAPLWAGSGTGQISTGLGWCQMDKYRIGILITVYKQPLRLTETLFSFDGHPAVHWVACRWPPLHGCPLLRGG